MKIALTAVIALLAAGIINTQGKRALLHRQSAEIKAEIAVVAADVGYKKNALANPDDIDTIEDIARRMYNMHLRGEIFFPAIGN
jgi:cell division protein FtsB